MFEFLKGYDENKLYDAGREIENQLHSKLVFAAMRSLSEYILFSLYEEYGNNKYDVRLFDLINNQEFVNRVKKDLHFNRFQTLDEVCRLGGNHALHISREFSFEWTPVDVKNGFKCTYELASNYYFFKFHQKAPDWSENEYSVLLSKASDPNARQKIETEYSNKLKEKESELLQAKKEAKEREKETKRLEKELRALKRASVDEQILETFESRIRNLEKINNEIDAKSIILKKQLSEAKSSKKDAQKRLEEIEKHLAQKQGLEREFEQQLKIEHEKYQKLLDKNDLKSDEIVAKNNELERQLKQIKEEKALLEEQLDFAEMSSVDLTAYNKLEEELKKSKESEASAKKHLNELEAKVEELHDRLYISDTKADKAYREYCDSQREINKLYEKQDEYKGEIEYLNHCIEEHNQNVPRCPNCKSALAPRMRKDGSKIFWACPNYPGCKFARDIEPGEMSIAKSILSIKGQLSDEWDKFKNLSKTIENKRSVKWHMDNSQIERLKKKYITYSQYPDSVKNENSTYWFESLEVPETLFLQKEKLMLSAFSRFKMITKSPCNYVDDKERQLYSLTLKLLNRGIVLPKNKEYSKLLSNKFYENQSGTLNTLFDFIEYNNPDNNYLKENELAFANSVFPEIFGASWATYVLVNPQLDVLLPEDDWNNFIGQCVSFCFWTKGKKIIIDIDSDINATQLRDSVLENAGYKVLHFKVEGFNNYKEIAVNQINSVIGGNEKEKMQIESDERYAVACKLSHQLAISLTKALEEGVIGQHSNIRVFGNSALFSQSELEYILTVATEELKEIIYNYSKIYDVEIDLDFFDNSVDPVNISIGCEGEYDIGIRDMYIPLNFLCEIEPFTLKYMPCNNISEAQLIFFLKYIFGYDSFRDGQVAALLRILEQKDSIILLPTGAGKSIIYQLAGFILPGITVVISPLNSLIEDQLSNLELRCGINNAISVTSVTSSPEMQKNLTAVMVSHNSTALLYISPERLQIPSFRKSIDDLLKNNNVCTVAIDEAHCVSEWGHDFRPAYLNIGETSRSLFKKNNYTPSLLALTGTASDAVLSDVQRDLSIFGDDSMILPETFDREELQYSIINCSALSKTASISDVIKNQLPSKFNSSYEAFSKRNGEKTNAGIIFTPIARNSHHPTEYDAMSLQLRLIDRFPELGVDCYFSSTPDDYEEASWKEKIRESARKFKNNEINLLVATKAYGMGIDKSNIRYTIHDGLPSSIEQFYQEAGRAGRDRNYSECILVFSNDNANHNEEMLDPALSIDEFLEKYEAYKDKFKYDGKDDLSSALFFHVSNFKGVQSECDILNEIIDNISMSSEFSPGVSIEQMLLKRNGQSKNDAEKEWLRAMIRLSVLGVIKEYTYDYCGHFKITFGSMDKQDISFKYGQYVSGTDKGKARIEVDKINAIKETGWDLVKGSVKILVEYIYDKIEKGRRAALRSMFQMAKQASSQPEEKQCEFIRDAILQYLTLKTDARNELIDIRDSVNAGWDQLEEILPLHTDVVAKNNEERAKANKIKGAVGRMLESNADHPGLLLMRAIAEIKAGNYEVKMVANDINAAFRFASERKINDKIRREIIIKTLNLTLNSSVELYEKTIEQISKYQSVSREELQNELIKSPFISDANRDYILLDLISNKLYERL